MCGGINFKAVPTRAGQEAVDEIKARREQQFDPAVVDAFLGLEHAAPI